MAKRERRTRSVSERILFACQQRQQANEYSKDLWEFVRGRRILGAKFRREHPLGPYTLDFICLDCKLDIEIDGKNHFTEAGRQHAGKTRCVLSQTGVRCLEVQWVSGDPGP